MKTKIAPLSTLLMLVALISATVSATFALTPETPEPLPSESISSPEIIIPAGTPILIRTNSTLNTAMNIAGSQFPATLAADIVVDGRVIIPRGTFVQGHVAEAVKAGRLGRRAILRIDLTDIEYGNALIPVVTDLKSSAGEENDTGVKTGAGAAIGGILGGWSGVAKGAAVGFGVSAATKGRQIEIPSGSLLEFRLQQPIMLDMNITQ